MQCPNCNAEMKEGSLYCYECGADIHIVPDYDPNLELQIEDTVEENEEYYDYDERSKKMSSWEKVVVASEILALCCLIIVFVFGTVKLLNYDAGTGVHKDPSAIQTGEVAVSQEQSRAPVIPPPRFSYDEGYYNEIIPLKLNAEEGCKVYYTLDGSNPMERGLLFRDTIFLDNGTYEIKAVCQAENGRFSDVISKVYQVEIILPDAPVVITLDGDYSRPTFIEVEMTEEEEEIERKVVYTTDGSEPTIFSTEYTEPIPMPLGESVYKFAYVDEEGVLSEVTERNFKLTLFGSISLVSAKDSLYQTLFNYGKRVEKYCNDEGYGVYRYVYANVTTIDNMDFYVFDEILVRSDVTGPTDRHYGIHVSTGAIYFLENNGMGGYRLVSLSEIFGEQTY